MKTAIFTCLFLTIWVFKVSAQTVSEPIFDDVEKIAEFPGGYPAMSKYFKKYFPIPETSHVRSWAIVRATIDSQGFIQKIEVLKNPGGVEIEKKIRLAVGKMGRWKPGILNDKPVASRATFPVRFCLNVK